MMKLFFQIIFLWTTLSSTHCFWWMYGKTASGGLECPSDLTSSATLLPDENDCQRYFACAHGRKIPRSCPDGLLFNPKVQVCDYPHNVNCPIKECPPTDAKDQTVLLPDPNNCGKFFICTHGKKVPMSCPPQLHFNPELNVCDYPDKVQCENTNYGPKILQSARNVCDGPKVYIPHEYECSKFYVCSNGIPHVITCPSGLHFDPKINVCNWPAEADCNKPVASNDEVDDQFYYQNGLIDHSIVSDDAPWLKISTAKQGEDVQFTGSTNPGAKDPIKEETQEIQSNIKPNPSTSPPFKPSKPTGESNVGGIIETIASQLLDFFTGGDDSEEIEDEDEDEKLLRKMVMEEALDTVKDLLNVLVDEVRKDTLKNYNPEIDGNKEIMGNNNVSDENVSTTTDHLPKYKTESVQIQNSFPDREKFDETTLSIENLTSTVTSDSFHTETEKTKHKDEYFKITVSDTTQNSAPADDINSETTPEIQDTNNHMETIFLTTTILADTTQTSTTINEFHSKTLTELSHSTQTSITVTENVTPTSIVSDTIQNSALTLENTTVLENSSQPTTEDISPGMSLIIESTTPTSVASGTIENNTVTTVTNLVTTMVLEDSTDSKISETEDVPSTLSVTDVSLSNYVINSTTESEGLSQDMSLTIENTTLKVAVLDKTPNTPTTTELENVVSVTTPMLETTQVTGMPELVDIRHSTFSLMTDNAISTSVMSDTTQNSTMPTVTGTTNNPSTTVAESIQNTTTNTEDILPTTITDTIENSTSSEIN